MREDASFTTNILQHVAYYKHVESKTAADAWGDVQKALEQTIEEKARAQKTIDVELNRTTKFKSVLNALA